MGVALTERDRALLRGAGSPAEQLSMRIIVALAEAMGAPHLIDVTRAHIDSCLYHGRAGLDFAERLRDGGARVAVHATLNVSSLDLLHPDLYRGDVETGRRARRLMTAYEDMGCRPAWTCAPYQLEERPGFGEQVAWAESNAIVFANSVLGARTHRYGDFVDICAAITGRVPFAGLHVEANRRGSVVLDVRHLPPSLLDHDVFYPVLGHLMGKIAGTRVAVVDGLPAGVGEDRLKAVGAAAASSGAVAMFHAVGITPEAPTLEAALGGRRPQQVVALAPIQIREARDDLSTAESGITAVSLGTPHYSLAELARLVPLLAGHRVAAGVALYVSTGRDVLREAQARGWAAAIEAAGATIVVDTCTYITPIVRDDGGAVMTDSGKWAYYAPGNLGRQVVFGSMEECVASALAGEVQRDPGLWAGV
jgi:predicted aconitase